jgi:4-carboxymuconolactone decarboxylase
MDQKNRPRVVPLEPPFDRATENELMRWMPPQSPVEPLALFRTLSRNLALAAAMWPLGSFQLSKRSSLTVRQRELVILRTCAQLDAEYEWGVHAVAYAGIAGLDEKVVEATRNSETHKFADDDALIVGFVDALMTKSYGEAIDDVHAKLSDEQLLELTVLCGWYHAISFVCRVAEVPLEPWALRFPTSGVDETVPV